jgi:hypothetical protein
VAAAQVLTLTAGGPEAGCSADAWNELAQRRRNLFRPDSAPAQTERVFGAAIGRALQSCTPDAAVQVLLESPLSVWASTQDLPAAWISAALSTTFDDLADPVRAQTFVELAGPGTFAGTLPELLAVTRAVSGSNPT